MDKLLSRDWVERMGCRKEDPENDGGSHTGLQAHILVPHTYISEYNSRHAALVLSSHHGRGRNGLAGVSILPGLVKTL